MSTLKDHQLKLKSKVNGWDIISTGLGLAGGLMFAIACTQPKHSLNGIRLFAALGCFSASVLSERARESDLFDLDKAIDFESNIKKAHIKFESAGQSEIRMMDMAEEMFKQVPVDRHAELAKKLGVQPPNYAARQTDPLVQPATQPVSSATAVDTKIPDPTNGFDPEEREQDDRQESSGMMLIAADRVSEWFEHMGDAIPDSLKTEWLSNPGTAIEVIDGTARILR